MSKKPESLKAYLTMLYADYNDQLKSLNQDKSIFPVERRRLEKLLKNLKQWIRAANEFKL